MKNVFIFALISVLVLAVAPNAAARQRPLSDFLSQQGTYCLNAPACDLFVPPSPNMVGWTVTGKPPFSLLDYAGLANNWLIANGGQSLGTTITGTINERPLADGRASVEVILHTKNALVWVTDTSIGAWPGPLTFGYFVDMVLGGAPPALANADFKVVFTNTAPGAPLPDLIQLSFAPLPGQGMEFLSIHARGTGTFPDGSRGEVVIQQTGIFVTKGGGATGDGFPAEIIDLHHIGR